MQGKKPVVLLIEADPSLRRLISIGLQSQGMQVIESSSSPHSGFDIEQLDLLVLDVDNGIKSDWAFLSTLQAHAQLSTIPIVVLAWEYLLSDDPSASVTTPTQVTCLTKPFDARALHETIDQLLQAQALKQAVLEAHAEELLLASYSKHATPSIWPVVTAAGLLLAVIGLLLQITIAALGMIIVVIALLLWTVGTRTETSKVPMGV